MSLESRIEMPAAAAEAAPEKAPAAAPAQADGNDEEDLVQNRYEVAVKLADMQEDPNSPLYSIKRFEDLGLYVDPQSFAHPASC